MNVGNKSQPEICASLDRMIRDMGTILAHHYPYTNRDAETRQVRERVNEVRMSLMRALGAADAGDTKGYCQHMTAAHELADKFLVYNNMLDELCMEAEQYLAEAEAVQ